VTVSTSSTHQSAWVRGADEVLLGFARALRASGVAETLDWARALHHLGSTELDLATASATLGALVKYREDADRVRQALDQMLRT